MGNAPTAPVRLSAPVDVLVVDDEQPVHDTVEMLLLGEGYRFHHAMDGESGQRLWHEIRPACTLLDLRMPKMDGHEFLAGLEPDWLQVNPVIVMTGHGGDDDIEQCYENGAMLFLRKPPTGAELRGAVRSMVSHWQYSKRLEETHLREIERAYAFYEGIERSVREGLLVLAPGGRVVHANPMAQTLFCARESELFGKMLEALWEPDPHLEQSVLQELRDGIALLSVADMAPLLDSIPLPALLQADGQVDGGKATRNRRWQEGPTAHLDVSQRPLAGVVQPIADTTGVYAAFPCRDGCLFMARIEREGEAGISWAGLKFTRAGQMLTGREDNEISFRRQDGSRFTALVAASRLVDRLGEEHGVVVSLSDITERLEKEAQIRHAHRLEAVGTMAAGIAHDFNNLINIMLGHAELAALDVPTDSDAADSLDHIVRAAGRAKEIASQLRDFSKKSESGEAVFCLRALVQETVELLRASLVGVELVFDCAPGDFSLNARASELQQVLINMAINADHAMRGRPSPRLTFHLTRRDGDALLTIADNGSGIAPENLARIFDPFFTTKEVGQGTGLGLSVAQGIIERMGGRIECQSELGQGTRFLLHLPLETVKPETLEPAHGHGIAAA